MTAWLRRPDPAAGWVLVGLGALLAVVLLVVVRGAGYGQTQPGGPVTQERPTALRLSAPVPVPVEVQRW